MLTAMCQVIQLCLVILVLLSIGRMRLKGILIEKCKKTLCTFLRLLANMISVKRVIYSSKNFTVKFNLSIEE